MKPCSPLLQNYLASSDQLRYADLVTITYISGYVQRFTSSDIDVVYDGNIYYSSPCLVTRSQVSWKAGLEVDTLDLDIKEIETGYNYLNFPESFDNSVWGQLLTGTAGVATITANAVAGPYGHMTADRISFPVTDSVSTTRINQLITVPFVPVMGSKYTWSLWMRASQPANIKLFLKKSNAAGAGAKVTTSCALTTLWKNYSVTDDAGWDSSQIIVPVFSPLNNCPGYVVDVWGGKLEPGIVATSYTYSMIGDVIDGGADDALVTIDRLYMQFPGDSSLGTVNLFTGNVGDISELGRSHLKMKVNSKLHKLNAPMPKHVFQPQCWWTLFDAGCTLKKAAFAVNSSVQAGVNNTRQIITNLTQPDNNFDLGQLVMTSGANKGVSRTVRNFSRQPSGTNLIANGDGETGTVGSPAPSWTFGAGNALNVANDFWHAGSKSLKIVNSSATSSYSYQNISVVDQGVYLLSGWIKTDIISGAGLGAILNIDPISGVTSFTILQKVGRTGTDPNLTQPDVGVQIQGLDWTFVFCSFKVNGTGTIRLNVQLGYGANNAGTAWFDDVKIQANVPVLVPYKAFPHIPQPGDTFTVYPGCDRRQVTCDTKFHNIVNFGGTPFVPIPETAI